MVIFTYLRAVSRSFICTAWDGCSCLDNGHQHALAISYQFTYVEILRNSLRDR